MHYAKISPEAMLQQIAVVLVAVKSHASDASNLDWVYYKSALDMRNEIDKYIVSFEMGSSKFLEEVNVHFAPTAAYQEHAMANDWVAEYYVLADRFDKLYAAIKKNGSL